MGEAKRRKLLDPNYGKPNLISLLLNSNTLVKGSKITIDILYEFAKHFVPQAVLDDLHSFSENVESFPIPEEIAFKYQSHSTRELMELDWCNTTSKWIPEFLKGLVSQYNLTNQQYLNANNNIRKALAVYLCLTPYSYESEE